MDPFESYRAYLFSIAYRMLGSAMDAEDMVQETYLRYRATAPDAIASPKAFLTTIVVRLCTDQLHLARRQRETYVGPWLPEPISDVAALQEENPAERVDVEESVSLAFLVLLERLQPVERAVFLLREVFEYEYAEIASFLGKSELACRQAFSRAKKHLADHRPRFSASDESHRVDVEEVNGEPALVIRDAGRAYFVLTIEVWAQQIHSVRIVANPDKLAHV
jgi:RNA polymerase sigma-70 factor (ECF subfamily)